MLSRSDLVGSRFDTEGLRERCTLVEGDLTVLGLCAARSTSTTSATVFHLGAQTQVGDAYRDPLATWETNIRGTYMLFEAVREHGPGRAVVVASSDKAYGSHDELPYREDFALQPSYPYDVSKAATDMIARSYAATYEMPVAVTRLANVYGPGDVNWARVIPDTARALVRGERPVIRSDGSPERDYIYVEDAAEPTWPWWLARRPRQPRPRLERRLGQAAVGPRGGDAPDRDLGSRRGARHPGNRGPARGDRPPVPRPDGHPRRAGVGAEMGPRPRPASGVGVVRADARA